MKLMLFLFFTLVTMSMGYIEVLKLMELIPPKREEVNICLNKANVTVETVGEYERLEEDSLPTEFNETTLKVGCFLACVTQKQDIMTGANINMDKIKEVVRSQLTPDKHASVFQVFDTCGDQVKDKTNECEVSIKFAYCLAIEAERYKKDHNGNE